MVLDEKVTAAYHTGDGDPPTPEAPDARHGRLARFGAGLLSAIIPGLGHLVTGRRRLAALFLAPVVLGLLVLVGLFLTQNTLALAASLIDPSIVGAILVLEILFLVWRVAAVVSSMVDRSFPRFRVADGAGLVLVLALVVLPQAGIAVLTSATQAAESDVFVDEPFPSDDAQSAAPSFSPGDSFFPSTEPSASASSALPPRVTVLLIGVDSGVGRNTAATDTMIVASLDPVAKTVSMVSVPRDMVDAPLPKGKTFSPKINGLVANVRWNPGNYPGYSGHGQAVLAYSLGKMLGVHIDYYAQVDLEGFVQAVNAVGGVDVSVDHAMCDARYNEYGFDGYSIGRWIDEDGDGRYDLLEVETRNLSGPRAYDASGLPLHEDNETIVKERIFLDKDNQNLLHDEISVFDHALTRPWTVMKSYRRSKEANPYWREYICSENNNHVAVGKDSYFLSADGYLMPSRKGQEPPDLRYFKPAAK